MPAYDRPRDLAGSAVYSLRSGNTPCLGDGAGDVFVGMFFLRADAEKQL